MHLVKLGCQYSLPGIFDSPWLLPTRRRPLTSAAASRPEGVSQSFSRQRTTALDESSSRYLDLELARGQARGALCRSIRTLLPIR